jgi:UDP-GlcNAc:undecaprenyl-phosphate GlcNAc-1-phosphate transferase
MKTYLGVFFCSALLVELATPLAARIARRLGMLDDPGPRKVHSAAVPRIGGVAIVMGTLLAVAVVMLLDNRIARQFEQVRPQVLVMLGAGTFLFLVGLWDDLHPLSGRAKLLSILAACLAVCATGARIEEVRLMPGLTVVLGWTSWPVTVLWIMAITIAVNFIDGLDGLAAGISMVVCFVIALLAGLSGQAVMVTLMLALAGALTGFLYFNFNPARIFMGDCGSMFLGFVIAASGVVCQAKTCALVGLALPCLAMGIPLFDAACAILRRRLLQRRSPFAADGEHIHHRLLGMGVGHRTAVVMIYVGTLAVTAVGAVMLTTDGPGEIVAIVCAAAMIVGMFRVAGGLRVRAIVERFRANSARLQNVWQEQRSFEDVQVRMRGASSADEWWQSLCAMSERMGFHRLDLVCADQALARPGRTWRRKGPEPAPWNLATVSMPVADAPGQGPARVEVAVGTDEELESVGRRISLLARLLDENGGALRVRREPNAGVAERAIPQAPPRAA